MAAATVELVSDSDQIRNLVLALEELDASWGVERTRRADELLRVAHEVLQAEGDRGVWQQTRPGNGTRASVAAELEKSVEYIQMRASRHSMRRK